jgi:hypothetical protein
LLGSELPLRAGARVWHFISRIDFWRFPHGHPAANQHVETARANSVGRTGDFMDFRSSMLDYASRFETYLTDQYQAQGRGLHEKIDSVQQRLSGDLVKQLRFVATVRNKAVHESDYVPDDPKSIIKTCKKLEIEFDLPQFTERKTSVEPQIPGRPVLRWLDDAELARISGKAPSATWTKMWLTTMPKLYPKVLSSEAYRGAASVSHALWTCTRNSVFPFEFEQAINDVDQSLAALSQGQQASFLFESARISIVNFKSVVSDPVLMTDISVFKARFEAEMLYTAKLFFSAQRQTNPSVPPNRLVIGQRDEIYYFGTATEIEARSLGNALKNNGYFQDRGSTVQLIKGTDETVLSFFVLEGIWNDPKTVSAFESVARDVADSIGGMPVKLRLLNQQGHIQTERLVQ